MIIKVDIRDILYFTNWRVIVNDHVIGLLNLE